MYTLDGPQSHLKLFLEKHDIDFVDLLPPLRSHEQPVYNAHEDSHFNPTGHAVTAGILEAEIRRSFLPTDHSQR
jgi:hypothetical protein